MGREKRKNLSRPRLLQRTMKEQGVWPKKTKQRIKGHEVKKPNPTPHSSKYGRIEFALNLQIIKEERVGGPEWILCDLLGEKCHGEMGYNETKKSVRKAAQ